MKNQPIRHDLRAGVALESRLRAIERGVAGDDTPDLEIARERPQLALEVGVGERLGRSARQCAKIAQQRRQHVETRRQRFPIAAVTVVLGEGGRGPQLFGDSPARRRENGHGRVAILAREANVSTVVGLTGATDRFHEGDIVQVDGTTGVVEVVDEGQVQGG